MWQGFLKKVFKLRDKVALNLNKDDEEKPFLSHLDDLRTMLIRMAITLLVSVVGTFFFYPWLMKVVLMPLVFAGIVKSVEEAKSILQVLSPQEGFMCAVNLALISAVIVSFPFLLLFLLQFILPGLRENEKKLMFPALGIGFGLFLTGVFFSYFLVLPRALQFFYSFNSEIGVSSVWRLNEYITFATRFILIFGVSFELPVVVMALVKLDFLSYKVMKSTRAHALIAIAVFSAIITPTQDVLTLLLLVVPLYVLYEVCIWLSYLLERRERKLYPEYYAERDKDEAELNKEIEDWDNEQYNPFGGSDDDEDEDPDAYRRKESKTTEQSGKDPQKDASVPDEPAQSANTRDETEEESGEPSEERARSAESSSPADSGASSASEPETPPPDSTESEERKDSNTD